MKPVSRLSCPPAGTAVIGGAAVLIALAGVAAMGLLSEPVAWQPATPMQLLLHPVVVVLTSVAAGVAVWLGLFGAHSPRLGIKRALLIPAIFLPVLALVVALWSAHVQALTPAHAYYGPVEFQRLGLLWSLSFALIAIASYFVARASVSRTRGD